MLKRFEMTHPPQEITMIDLYKRIWRITGRSQVLLIALSLVVAVLAAVPLKFQKEIINGLTGTVMTVQTLLMLGAAYLGVPQPI